MSTKSLKLFLHCIKGIQKGGNKERQTHSKVKTIEGEERKKAKRQQMKKPRQ